MGARRAPKCAKFLQTFQAISKTWRVWPDRFFLSFPPPFRARMRNPEKTGSRDYTTVFEKNLVVNYPNVHGSINRGDWSGVYSNASLHSTVPPILVNNTLESPTPTAQRTSVV